MLWKSAEWLQPYLAETNRACVCLPVQHFHPLQLPRFSPILHDPWYLHFSMRRILSLSCSFFRSYKHRKPGKDCCYLSLTACVCSVYSSYIKKIEQMNIAAAMLSKLTSPRNGTQFSPTHLVRHGTHRLLQVSSLGCYIAISLRELTRTGEVEMCGVNTITSCIYVMEANNI